MHISRFSHRESACYNHELSLIFTAREGDGSLGQDPAAYSQGEGRRGIELDHVNRELVNSELAVGIMILSQSGVISDSRALSHTVGCYPTQSGAIPHIPHGRL